MKEIITDKRRVTIEVSVYEAAMIKLLRKQTHGEWRIKKLSGEPVQVIEGGSILLDPSEGFHFAINKGVNK